ncbi:condensation domain-containing protein [Leptolyngbya sp. AN02str]|uniref:condensation domain-containing protein n=1 Tax=Leptolyngbya sp. AN02str TaxID=3423363 RepID=UPI003D31CE0A
MNQKTIETIYPASPAQQGMLFATLSAPESGYHIEQLVCLLRGQLDVAAFEQAWQRVIDRHAILRTVFVWKDQDAPLQVVLRQVNIPLERQDWRSLSATEQTEKLAHVLHHQRIQGFSLSTAPLMRLTLIQLRPDLYRLIWSHHHILLDGWSQPLLFQEVLTLYQHYRTTPLPQLSSHPSLVLPPSRPYRDYILWLQQQDLAQAKAFWQQRLQGWTQPTALGRTIAPATDALPVPSHREQSGTLSAAATQTLQTLARQHHLTLNTVIQGIWALLLSHYSQTDDVVFGITVSGRPPMLPGSESMLGLLINTIPLRVRVDASAMLLPWLQTIRAETVELQQYENISTGQIHQWSEMPGSLPLYDSLLVFENYPNLSAADLADLEIQIEQTQGAQTGYPLTLLVKPDATLHIVSIYEASRLDDTSVGWMVSHVLHLLEHIAANPEQSLSALKQQLPAYEMPQMRVQPQRRSPSSTSPTSPLPPTTAVEKTLAEIWQSLLGVDAIGLQDHFFELGGHSLLATQLISRLRTHFQVELPLRCLFEHPTLAGLAAQLESVLRSALPKGSPALEPIQPMSQNRDRPFPLSFAQERLWFVEQLHPGNTAYNEPAALQIDGILDLEVFRRCLAEVIQRHEILRTTFPVIQGQPMQQIAPSLEVPLSVIDVPKLAEHSSANVQPWIDEWIHTEAQRPFDLMHGPLWWVTVLRLGDRQQMIVFTLHHIISDGWSKGVLVHELATLYRAFAAGQPSPLAPLPIQYADFAAWQRQWLTADTLDQQLMYWRRQLGGTLPVLTLPTDFPHPEQPTFAGAIAPFRLSSALTQALHDLSHRSETTLFMTLLAAFQVLLYRDTGQLDLIVGTDVANRNRAEVEGLIGFFVNLLVLRTDLSGNPSFKTLLSRVRDVTLAAYDHQDVPFAQLVELLQPDRRRGTPFFQVLFVLQNAPAPAITLPDLTLTPLPIHTQTAKFDLALFWQETPEGLVAHWNYRTDLFTATTIARMAQQFEALLQHILASPDSAIDALPMPTMTQPLRPTQLKSVLAQSLKQQSEQNLEQDLEQDLERSLEQELGQKSAHQSECCLEQNLGIESECYSEFDAEQDSERKLEQNSGQYSKQKSEQQLEQKSEQKSEHSLKHPLKQRSEFSPSALSSMQQSHPRKRSFQKIAPKAIQLPQTPVVQSSFFSNHVPLPLVLQPNFTGLDSGVDCSIDLADWVSSHRDQIEGDLLRYGAILFRGFGLRAIADFERVAQALCPQLFGEYGDLPRVEIGGKVYGSTPYPADQAILFHNESSHLNLYPLKIWFYCVQAAQQGGETPIVDCRQVYQHLRPQTRERFAEKQLMYVRQYIKGLDVCWQDFFHTSDPAVVEAYCRRSGMEFEWLDHDGLRTRQIRPAIAQHPNTHDWVFFNQIQLHHPSFLDRSTQDSLASLLGEGNFPRQVYYGDGSAIEPEVLAEIQTVYQQLEVCFTWQAGDVLMLDNMLTAHGRKPYGGARRIVVALGDMVTGDPVIGDPVIDDPVMGDPATGDPVTAAQQLR